MKYTSLKQGLVGAWCPSLGPTGYTLLDRSGYGNHGTLTDMDAGSDWVGTQYGWGLDFDGVNNRVIVPANDNLAPTNASYCAWIQSDSLSGTDKAFFSQSNSAGTIARAFRRNTDKVQFTLASASGVFRVWRSVSAITTSWTSVVLTQIGTATPRMYINGVESSVSLIASAGSIAVPSAQTLAIGYDGGFSSTIYNFDGRIDDCRLYSRVLSDAEIRLLANEPGIGLRNEDTTVFFGSATNRRRRLLTGMV